MRKILYFTSLSHLRLARSNDGINFIMDDLPTIMPNSTEEAWGIEDPRITKINNAYYITYTAVSMYGASAALICTYDFINYERLGVIFAPENKDVTIFPVLPILRPELPYEKEGFFKNVVFTCGVLLEEDTIIIYYGANDDKICRADISLEEMFQYFSI